MKKLTLAILLLTFISINAQIVNIPDVNFKNALLNHSPTIDTNNDGEIQITEAAVTLEVDVNGDSINDLTGIEEFINITFLDCSQNNLITIDVSNNTSLEIFECYENQLTTIDISNNTSLHQFECRFNQLTTLDLSNNFSMFFLSIGNNDLTEIDLSNNPVLGILECRESLLENLDISNNHFFFSLICNDNSNLISINLKNGNNDNITFEEIFASNFENLPNLESICVDDLNNTILTNTILNQVNHDITFTDNCTLSINDNSFRALQIYPNPTNNILNITSNSEIKQIEVFNLLGQSVLKHTNKNNINVSYLSKGVYSIKIIDTNKQFTFRKFIKY
jgi:hypothetical protein